MQPEAAQIRLPLRRRGEQPQCEFDGGTPLFEQRPPHPVSGGTETEIDRFVRGKSGIVRRLLTSQYDPVPRSPSLEVTWLEAVVGEKEVEHGMIGPAATICQVVAAEMLDAVDVRRSRHRPLRLRYNGDHGRRYVIDEASHQPLGSGRPSAKPAAD